MSEFARRVVLLSVIALTTHAATTQPAVDSPSIIEIRPDIEFAASHQTLISDANMTVIGPGHARVSSSVVYQSPDGCLQIDISEYEKTSLRLSDWPVDELMYFLEGAVEVTAGRGDKRLYHAGDTLIMPRGFSGTWRQLESIKKVAVSYRPSSSSAPARAPSTFAAPRPRGPSIVALSLATLRGSERAMKTISDWDGYLHVVDGFTAKYVELPMLISADRRAEFHVKRFEQATFELRQWPVHEFMHLLAGHVEISAEGGRAHVFGPGDSFVMPKGFSGLWRQKDTLDMITAVYDRAAP